MALDCCGALGGGGCGGILGCSSSSSVVVLSLLSEVSPVGEGPLAAQQVCQDGRGPQSAGWSGTGVAGCSSRSTSWHQYFLFDAL